MYLVNIDYLYTNKYNTDNYNNVFIIKFSIQFYYSIVTKYKSINCLLIMEDEKLLDIN